MSTRTELILAVDTSGGDAGLVLAGPDRIDVARLPRGDGGRARTENLAGQAAALLAARGGSVGDLTAVGAVVGPGSYTGLRSGLAFLRGLAFLDGQPAVAVGSLELLAWRGAGSAESVAAAFPAGPGRVVAAVYRRSGQDLTEIAEPRIVHDDELARFFGEAAGGCTAVVVAVAEGSGDDGSVAAAAQQAGLEVRHGSGDSLVELAALVVGKARRADTVRVASLLPVYVGTSSARPNRHRVALREAPH